jgi:hypothetical protein
MSKGKPDPNWKEKVLAWEVSGKSAKAWCKENQIPFTTLSSWKKRFKQLRKNQTTESYRPFIELKDKHSSNSGIFLECHGVKIHLELGFNAAVLKQCLVCLKGTTC